MASRWIVSVSSENDNPMIFGPYSEATAERVASKVNEAIDSRSPDETEGAFLYATAYPIRPETVTAILHEFGLRRPRGRV